MPKITATVAQDVLTIIDASGQPDRYRLKSSGVDPALALLQHLGYTDVALTLIGPDGTQSPVPVKKIKTPRSIKSNKTERETLNG